MHLLEYLLASGSTALTLLVAGIHPTTHEERPFATHKVTVGTTQTDTRLHLEAPGGHVLEEGEGRR